MCFLCFFVLCFFCFGFFMKEDSGTKREDLSTERLVKSELQRQTNRFQLLVLPFTSCVILSKFLDLFLPPFPLQQNEDTNRIYLTHLLLWLNDSICIVYLKQCLAYI